MGIKDDVTLGEMFRTSPVESGLFTLCPALIAVSQLLNSYVNDLAWVASVPLALALIAFAVTYTRYHRAQLRLRALERTTSSVAAD